LHPFRLRITIKHMRAIWAFVALHVIIILSSISGTAISVAFPQITAHYNSSLVVAGWVLSIYQLVAVSAMVLVGKVSEVFGRKRTFLVCCGLFIVGSYFSAIAPNIYFLIASRFIQSVGGGGFFPITTGIIVELFPRRRQMAIGLGMSLFNIGGIIGPNIGSWLITSYGWESIFWFNIPVTLVASIPLFFLLKSDKSENIPIDFLGAGCLSAFLFTFMIGLSQIAGRSGLSWIGVGLLLITSAAFLMVFIRNELKSKAPIIDLDILRLKAFVSANLYNFIYGACVFGFSSFIPLFVVSVYHMTTFESGYVLMARSIGMIAASLVSSFFLVRWGYRRPMLIGSIILCATMVLMGLELNNISLFGREISSLVLVSAICLIMGVAMGVSIPASANACIDLVPHRASVITGVRGMFRQSGGAIGIVMITLILQFAGDMGLGFNIVFMVTGLAVLFTIPFVFSMPDKAGVASAGVEI
jgi:EmrB/QacA subfamily drug resistance transporter